MEREEEKEEEESETERLQLSTRGKESKREGGGKKEIKRDKQSD